MITWMWLAWAGAAELTGRVEIESPSKFEDWGAVPIGEEGVIAIGSDTSAADGTMWTFQRYDTDFRPMWRTEHLVDARYGRVDVDVHDGSVYVAFARARSLEGAILRCDTEDGAITASPMTLPFKTWKLDQLVVNDGHAWLSGFGKKGGLLLDQDLATGTSTAVPLDIWTSVQRMRREGDHVDAVIATVRKNESSLRITEVGGASPRDIPLSSVDTGHNLLTARRVTISGGRQLVVGTYGATQKSTLSAGVYVAGVKDGSQVGVRFHSWKEFDQFFAWMPDAQEARVEQKVERKEAAGGESVELQLNYRLIVHDLLERGDELVMIAEAYYPEYQTVTTTRTQTVNGVTTTTRTTQQVFQGYRYTHAVVAGIGQDGALLWDHSFPIEGILSQRVSERVRVTDHEGDLTLLYVQGGTVHQKVIRGREIVDGAEEVKVEAVSGEVRQSWRGDAEYWYGQDFVAWGFDKIQDDDGKKHVFWFARLSSADAP